MRIAIHAHHRSLIATDVSALALALVVLFAASRVRLLLSPLAFGILAAFLVLGFAADIGLWFLKGIRTAEISEETLVLHSGRALREQIIPRRSITRARFIRSPLRRSIRLRLDSGRTVKIAEDAFGHEAFTRFLAACGEWTPPAARMRGF